MQRRERGVAVTAGHTAQQCGAVFGHYRDFRATDRFAGIHGLHEHIPRAVEGRFRDDPHVSDHHKARVENRIPFVLLIPFVIAFRFRGLRRFSRVPRPQAQQEYTAFCGRISREVFAQIDTFVLNIAGSGGRQRRLISKVLREIFITQAVKIR